MTHHARKGAAVDFKPVSAGGAPSRDQGLGITGGMHARQWRKITTNEYAKPD